MAATPEGRAHRDPVPEATGLPEYRGQRGGRGRRDPRSGFEHPRPGIRPDALRRHLPRLLRLPRRPGEDLAEGGDLSGEMTAVKLVASSVSAGQLRYLIGIVIVRSRVVGRN